MKGNVRSRLRLPHLAGLFLLLGSPARAEVQVFVEPGKGAAWLKYRCAPTLDSAWVATDQTNGIYMESVSNAAANFFRVRQR